MAMSKSGNLYNRKNWEESDFPILCQTCLGENPYVRMMRERYGSECKICERPFTVFRWCPGRGMRFKRTEICQTCSKMKNVCQTCILDLEYGLPVQVRDSVLNLKQDDVPKSDVGREFYMQKVENSISNTDGTVPYGALGKVKGNSKTLSKLARTAPYYNRNKPHICSFWVKGRCNRGEECPYRHEKPTDPESDLADQNIRDRFHGNSDPVALKILKRLENDENDYDSTTGKTSVTRDSKRDDLCTPESQAEAPDSSYALPAPYSVPLDAQTRQYSSQNSELFGSRF